MSEDEARKLGHEEDTDETEAHGRATANIEAGDEADGDDVDAHGRATANIEPGDEGDDDVDAHMRRRDVDDGRAF